MLRAADVHVHGQHLVHRLAGEGLFFIVRIRIAQVVPARADKGVQRVGIALCGPAAVGAGRVHELVVLGERGFAVGAEFHVVGEFYGQILFGDCDVAADGAVDDGNGRAPVALTGHQPVAQAVVDLLAALAQFGDIGGDFCARLVAVQPVKLQRADHDAVLGEGKLSFAALLFNDLDDGEIVFGREGVVALVVRGNRHDRARAVGCKDVVRKIDGDLLTVDGVGAVRAREHARLFAGGGEALDLVCLCRLFDICLDGGALLGRRELACKGVLGRQHDVRHAEYRVAAGGEHADLLSAVALKFDLAARGLADPVALHILGLFRPVECVQPGQKLFRVVGDLEEPLRQVLAHDLRAAALAAAVHDLLVCKHGLAGGAPVDGRGFAVGKSLLVQLQEHPLRPLVVVFFARLDLGGPVKHRAHCAQLTLHRRNVLLGGVLGVDARLDRVVLCGQAKGVKAHGLEHVVALHALEAGIGVRGPVVVPVPDMQLCAGRVGEHLQNIPLPAFRLLVKLIDLCLFPPSLPFSLDCLIIHAFPLKMHLFPLFYNIEGEMSSLTLAILHFRAFCPAFAENRAAYTRKESNGANFIQ